MAKTLAKWEDFLNSKTGYHAEKLIIDGEQTVLQVEESRRDFMTPVFTEETLSEWELEGVEYVLGQIEARMKQRTDFLDHVAALEQDTREESLSRMRSRFAYKKESLGNRISIPWLDLSLVFYMEEFIKDASGEPVYQIRIPVTNHVAEKWSFTGEDLMKAASDYLKEHPGEIMTLQGAMAEENPDAVLPQENNSMLVLRGAERSFGAVSLAMEEGWKAQLPYEACYIIPSSIHECILVPAEVVTDPDDLKMMITEINATGLHPLDILSDHPYMYTGERGEVFIP